MFSRGRSGSILESVKPTQVAIYSSPMQPCTVCLGASRNDWFRQHVTPTWYKNEYDENLILIFAKLLQPKKITSYINEW